jgi:uncharacterized protein (DUF1330 family)
MVVQLEQMPNHNESNKIAEHKVTDPAKFEEYRIKVGPMIADHGGRYLTKSGSHGHDWQLNRNSVIGIETDFDRVTR